MTGSPDRDDNTPVTWGELRAITHELISFSTLLSQLVQATSQLGQDRGAINSKLNAVASSLEERVGKVNVGTFDG